ncbi:MAG TPA: YceI family protein [Luteolibacter sp.]|nr:YceI family protein [Luteolibacter sp.]
MKTKVILLAIPAAVLFASCENPADQTTSATVGDAVEVAPGSTAEGVKYTLAPSSEIRFVGSKVTGSHDGGFKSFTGSFTVADGQLVGSENHVVIDMASIWSDDDKLTGHLKTEDFFHVEKHPESKFQLTSLKETGEGAYEVSGNLTITGTTRNLTFPATASMDGEKAKVHAKFDINRKDFGIVYDGMADDLIRDEVVVELKLEAVPEA